MSGFAGIGMNGIFFVALYINPDMFVNLIRYGFGFGFFCFVVYIVARSQSDSDAEVAGTMEEVSDIGIVGEDAQDFGDNNFSQAPGVDIVCVFPKNSARCKSYIDIAFICEDNC